MNVSKVVLVSFVLEISLWMMLDGRWLGRPVEVDSNQIEVLTENNLTMQEIADILKISKSKSYW